MVRTPDDIADQSGAPTPTVSVVVPVYNGGRSIRQTLTSVLAQTRSDIEVIVVDDGSTDDTAEIVRTFTRRDSRVRLLRQSNGGVAAARNRGIREARGDFVAPIDADDVWLPEYLERQVAALEAGGPAVTFCYAGFFRLDEANRVMQLPRGHGAPSADYISLLRRNLVGCGSATVFRRDAVLAVGGYDESLRARHAQGCEDWKLILMLASRSTGTSEKLPSPGVGQLLTSEEVRYCVFQGRRLDFIRDQVSGDIRIQRFNALVRDFNSRCGLFRFQNNALRVAKGLADARQEQLKADAGGILAAWESTGNEPLIDVQTHQGAAAVQARLKALGYYHHNVDGVWGLRSEVALSRFRRTMGLGSDGTWDLATQSALLAR